MTRMLMIPFVLWALIPGLIPAQVPAPAATQDPPIPANGVKLREAAGARVTWAEFFDNYRKKRGVALAWSRSSC